MSKTIKICFEMSGTQVDADFFSEETLKNSKKLASKNDWEEEDFFNYLQENREGSGKCLAQGMYVEADELKCTMSDGNETITFFIMPFHPINEDYDEIFEEKEFENVDYIMEADFSKGTALTKKDDPSKNEHVLLTVIDYDYGQLEGEFEVEDNFDLKDINMKDFFLKTFDLDGESELSDISYGQGTVGDIYEVEVSELFYKGTPIGLNLNFQGGGGHHQIFIRDEDGDLCEMEFEEIVEQED